MLQIKWLLLILIVLLGFSDGLIAQEKELEGGEFKHGINFLVSHSYISQGKIEGKREFVAEPSLGINYNYYINEKWAIGLHNDIILASFAIEDSNGSSRSIEREYPVSNVITGTYKLNESFGIALGGGVEWSKDENLGMLRFGADYALEVNEKGLEVLFLFNYDNHLGTYDSINFGIGLNKLF